MFKAFSFPNTVRMTCSSLLPNLKHLKVVINSPEAVRNQSVLLDSLQWMAPTLQSLYINETEIFTDGWLIYRKKNTSLSKFVRWSTDILRKFLAF